MSDSGGTPDLYRTILGIRFFVGSAAQAAELGLKGGLVVAPSAPVLVLLDHDVATREALEKSDLALTDSGLMVLLWNRMRGERIPRISGLEYLRLLMARPELKSAGATFWVMPSLEARDKTMEWLQSSGFAVTEDDFYVAPHYGTGALYDPLLIAQISRQRPQQVFMAIGGGVQERLAYDLRQRLDYLPGIHCIGAAIGFLTGDQVNIPPWADRWKLGWLLRSVQEPGKFVPRYWRARKLVTMLLEHGEKLPPLRESSAD